MSFNVSKITAILKKNLRLNILDYDIEFIKKIYKIEYIIDYESVIYILVNIFNNNRKILRYIEKARDTFNIDRYEKYLEWRKDNKYISNTPDFFKLVYGDDNWEYHFKNKKVTRIYDPNYIMKRDECSYDEAVKTINKMKSDKVTSLEGFVKRHGIDKGHELFEKFQKTSNIFDRDNIINKYGDDRYEEIYHRNIKSRRENSKMCPEYWIKRGFEGDEVISKISEYQKYFSGVSKDAIIRRFNGDLEYAEYVSSVINNKKDSNSFKYCLNTSKGNYLEASILYVDKCNRKDHRSIYNFNSHDEYLEYNDKLSNKSYNTLLSKSLTIDRKEIKNYKEYCNRVNYYTKLNLRLNGDAKFGFGYDKTIKVNENHVDHNFSKFQGFINNVHPKIIGSIENLEILNYIINIRKNKNSWIELDVLYHRYENSIYLKIQK